jgi:hypothetical protein
MSLERLLSEARRLHEATPALADFAPWPSDLTATERPPRMLPCVSMLQGFASDTPAIAALQAAAPLLEWRQTYSADEVGDAYLQSYGYIELFGTKGHYHSTELRGYFGFWGPGLLYDWHTHPAEEIYFGLLGRAHFFSDQQPDASVEPGGWRWHPPFERHSMQTREAPFLCYALWKGDGLAQDAQMLSPSSSEAVGQTNMPSSSEAVGRSDKPSGSEAIGHST